MGDGNLITQRDTLTGDGTYISHRYQKQGRYPITLYMYERHKGNIQVVCTYQYPRFDNSSRFFVNVVDSNATSIKRVTFRSNQFDIRLIPNPNQGNFKVKLYNQLSNSCNVIIKDVSGKVVYQKEMNDKEEEFSVQVDFLSKGLYFVTVDNLIEQVTHKLIIQ
jgi:hypothetical protein